MNLSLFIKASGNVVGVDQSGGGLLHSDMAAKIIKHFGPEERRIDISYEELNALLKELDD